jgi:hypothetical protein
VASSQTGSPLTASPAASGARPAHAWERFSSIERDQVPEQLRQAIERVVALARG